MSCWQKVANTSEIPVGEGRTFSVDGQLIAVFNLDDQFYALNDLCPHMGASLAEGHVEHGAVMCPWHAWRFCVKDGTWLDNPKASVKAETYPVRVEADAIHVDVFSSKDVIDVISSQDEDISNDEPPRSTAG